VSPLLSPESGVALVPFPGGAEPSSPVPELEPPLLVLPLLVLLEPLELPELEPVGTGAPDSEVPPAGAEEPVDDMPLEHPATQAKHVIPTRCGVQRRVKRMAVLRDEVMAHLRPSPPPSLVGKAERFSKNDEPRRYRIVVDRAGTG